MVLYTLLLDCLSLLPNPYPLPPRAIFDLAIFSVPEPFYPCYGPEIDPIHDVRHLCTRLIKD